MFGPDAPAILFVDDDLANLKVLEVHLRSDFNILTAQNGTDALALLDRREHDIALVVADQRMAGMTGVELLTIVRSRFHDVGRMLITAFADLEPIIAAINEGQISGYIRKPWNPTDIRLLLRSGLQRVLLERRLHHAELELLSAERDAVLGFIGVGIGHELNQPATVLRMNLEVLREWLDAFTGDPDGDGGAADAKSALADCLRASDDLSVLSADLRVLVSRRGPAKESTGLNVAVQRALRFVDARLASFVQVDINLDEIPEVRADESGLTHVIVSLLIHALQYLENTDGRRYRLSICSRVRNGRMVLTLRDNGPGIPAAELQRVFDPLFTETPEHGPRRVGLALPKRTVEAWGGELSVESGADVGTEYELQLRPARPSLSVVRDDSVEGSALPRVLVVDDEPSVLRAVQRILRGKFEVDVAGSGEEALRMLEADQYAAILCDLQMPQPDGVEIFQRMGETKPELAGRFAFMTGGALSQRITSFVDSVENSGVTVLDKPFDHLRIREVVTGIVNKEG